MNPAPRLPLLALALALAVAPARALYLSMPSLLTDEHNVIVRPDDWRDSRGATQALASVEGAAFEGRAVPVTGPVTAELEVRYPGDYTLWVRAGQRTGGAVALKAALLRGDKPVLDARFHDGKGAPGRGGVEAWRAYEAKARFNTPKGAAVGNLDAAMTQQGSVNKKKAADDPLAADVSALADELISEFQAGTADQWINLLRLDQPGDNLFYWWTIGKARLEPGTYTLRVAPEGPTPKPADAPPLDAAFLTTCPALLYPFSDDIAAPRASYVRFRLDKLPASGVHIQGFLATMFGFPPYLRTPTFQFAATGLYETKKEAHTKTGFTRWYALQDIKRAPHIRYGRRDQFRLEVQGFSGPDGPVQGLTQFAMYPFADEVVREFAWSEPSGLDVSLVMDFGRHPESLATFRDHAREHYEFALAASEERVFPLARGDLFLWTGAGTTPDTADYVLKTMRLLGFNTLSAHSANAQAEHRRYGWRSFAGEARMSGFIPFDEEKARRDYVEEYRRLADPKRRELLENVPLYQMVDEPGEQARDQLSSPLWVYEENQGRPRWVDYPGSSELHTRSFAYSNCVLEGVIEKLGSTLEIRAGTDQADMPTNFVWWRIGAVLPDNAPETLMVGTNRQTDYRRHLQAVVHKAADIRDQPVPFKLVHDGTRAALYFNGTLLYQHENVRASGGFGFASGTKAVSNLRFRPLRAAERLAVGSDALAMDTGAKGDRGGGAAPDIGDALADEDLPDWARPKPLKAFVEQDWVVCGGIPGAQEGFRRWAADQGCEPALFGQAQWDDVRMLTLPHLVRTPEDARRFYWSRRYSGFLTPRMWALAMDGMHASAPNPAMRSYVGLSGGYPNVFRRIIVDMFRMAGYTNGLVPGISDWYTGSAEGSQVNAFSAAFFNAGARRFGRAPASISMMHCVAPVPYRTYTSFGNNVKCLSFYNFGPSYNGIDDWSDNKACYPGAALLNNRLTQADDLAAPGLARPGRVALLYAMANDYWDYVTFVDKRASFLALSHEYFQPELVSEDHLREGALDHFDALYVMDPVVAAPAQAAIRDWVRKGGLLWLCADAGVRNEYNEPLDLAADVAGIRRAFAAAPLTHAANDKRKDRDTIADGPRVAPVPGETDFTPHTVIPGNRPASVEAEGARVRARYADGQPAWLEVAAGKGRVVYVGHRAGQTYSARVVRAGERVWPATGRALLTAPLHEAGVARELVLSEPAVMASPLSTDSGTLVVLYNMNPAPLTNVQVRLREPKAPVSVETFEGYTLKPLDHRFQDGWLTATLPSLDGGQMLVVRRAPAPADDRLAKLEAAARDQLASAEPDDQSAGAFLAGFHPEWNLADKLPRLLTSPAWDLRRQAAESLGRLGYIPAGDALAAAAEKDPDAHARGDALYSLAQVGHPRARDLGLLAITNRQVFLQRRAAEAARLIACPGDQPPADPGLKAFGLAMAEAALANPDIRVRREGIRLMGLLDAGRTLSLAVQAFAGPRPDDKAQPHWAQALADHDEAFAAYVKDGLPGGPGLVLALAQRRRDPALAAALGGQLAGMAGDEAAAYMKAIAFQQDPALARRALAERATLPEEFKPLLPYALEVVFARRLGADLALWDEWARPKPD